MHRGANPGGAGIRAVWQWPAGPRGWEIARFCARWDMRLEEILGSDGYVRQLVDLAQQLSNQAGEILPDGIAGAHATQCDRAQISPDEDSMVIPPGGEIRQALFVR